MIRHLTGTVAVTLLLASIAGCAHVHALQPVNPDQRTKVRFAAIDVLEAENVALQEAPHCQRDDRRDVVCTGTTSEGDPVTAMTPRDDLDALTVTVGDDQIFSGSLNAVLEQAASGD